ncbi:MAG: hypothetical protein WA837_15940 [Xanthobacteraceae bacterium]
MASADTARPVENSSTPSQQSFVAPTAASLDQKPNAEITDSRPAALNPLFAVWRVYDIDVEMLSLFVAAGETDFDFIRTAEIRAPHDSWRRRQTALAPSRATAIVKATGDTGSGDCAWARCASRTPREVRGKPLSIMANSTLFCCVGSVA